MSQKGIKRGVNDTLANHLNYIWWDLLGWLTSWSWTSLVLERSCSSLWLLLSLVAWCSFCSCSRAPCDASTWPCSSSFCWINSCLASCSSPSSWKSTDMQTRIITVGRDGYLKCEYEVTDEVKLRKAWAGISLRSYCSDNSFRCILRRLWRTEKSRLMSNCWLKHAQLYLWSMWPWWPAVSLS